MKIAICEDESVYSDKINKLVSAHFEKLGIKAEISVFTDGKPLISACKNGARFNLILLDIQLESSDGMSVAAKIRESDTDATVIFVTNIENRAVEGYSVSAFDYIVKSSLDKRLPEVLDRFMQKWESGSLTVQTADGETIVVSFDDIIYIESEGRGTAIYTFESVIGVPMPITRTAELLPKERFTEIHRSIFVRTSKIRRIGSDTVEMFDGKTLPLSRRKRKAVLSSVMAAVRNGVK